MRSRARYGLSTRMDAGKLETEVQAFRLMVYVAGAVIDVGDGASLLFCF